MGGYGIVGGNLPLAAGMALSSDYRGTEEATRLRVRRRRLEPGHVRRDAEPRGAVEPARGVHGHQQPVRHGHLARAPLRGHRPARARRGLRRAGHALRRHGRARHLRGDRRGAEAGARRSPAGARRGDHLPLPRPLDGRPRGVPQQGAGRGVAQEGPDPGLRAQARGGGHPRGGRGREARRGDRQARSTRPSTFADKAAFPPPESLYDDVYVLGDQVKGWYSVDERSAGVHRGEHERELAEQERGPQAAYGDAVEQARARGRRRREGRPTRRRPRTTTPSTARTSD